MEAKPRSGKSVRPKANSAVVTPQTAAAPAVATKVKLPAPGSNEAKEARLRELYGRLFMTSTTEAVWDQVLTDRERAKLGTSCQNAVQTLQTWNAAELLNAARGGGRRMATLEAALSQQMISVGEYRVLRRYVAEVEGKKKIAPQKPLSGDGVSTVDKVRKARTESDIVVVNGDSVRTVFWKGALCDGRWDDALESWEFVYKLAKAAERGRRCDPQEFGPDDTRRTISSKKYNLVRAKRIPKEMATLIKVESRDCDVVYFDTAECSVRVIEAGRSITSVDDLLL